jgi:hypothetical protein
MQCVHPQSQQDHLNGTVEKLSPFRPGAWPQGGSQNRQDLAQLRPKIRDRETGHGHLVLGSAPFWAEEVSLCLYGHSSIDH